MDGRAIRTNQLLHPRTGKAVIVAFDHGGTGVPKGGADVGSILSAIGRSKAEAILIGCGTARAYAHAFARPDAPRLIVSLDGPVFRRSAAITARSSSSRITPRPATP